jgi:hypothetical protein
MRKFFKGALLVGLAAASILILVVASLSLWTWCKTAQVEGFYQENDLLGKMRSGQKNSTNDSAPAREALLQIVPLKTDRETAVAVLRKEGLDCQTLAKPITDTRLRQRVLDARGLAHISNNGRTGKEFVNCQTMSPNVLEYQHWIVDLKFDADGSLSDASVAILNIFL